MKNHTQSQTLSRRRFTTQLLSAAGVGALGLPVIAPQQAKGCCMVPASYKGTISQSGQEGILFHKGDREELILRINYQIQGDTKPDRFAWVITVPEEPDRYGVADGELFEDMFDWAEKAMFRKPLLPTKSAPRALKADSEKAGGVELGKRVQVGPYDIQPVRARGADALGALNAWLKKNGFPTEDPGHMKYFIDKEFTFLAIKINPPKGEKTVRAGGDVEPLHLSFKSEKVYYPLRFSSRQGVFDLNLYVFTEEEFDYKASGDALKKINYSPPRRLKKNVDVALKDLPEKLRKQLMAKADGSVKEQTDWKANLVRTKDTNSGDAIASWTEDVFFAKSV